MPSFGANLLRLFDVTGREFLLGDEAEQLEAVLDVHSLDVTC